MKPGEVWTPWVQEEYPPDTPMAADQLFVNSIYQVSIRNCGEGPLGPLVMLSIKRRDRDPIHDWRDFQRIKNELCGPEAEGVELYPAESRLVDTSNQYFMFVLLKSKFPFGFNERFVTEATWNGSKQRPFDPDVRPKDLRSQATVEKTMSDFYNNRKGAT